jgi:hypothetical protein
MWPAPVDLSTCVQRREQSPPLQIESGCDAQATQAYRPGAHVIDTLSRDANAFAAIATGAERVAGPSTQQTPLNAYQQWLAWLVV